jgi:hypothetical protein
MTTDFEQAKPCITAFGLSTDVKPSSDIATGSVFIEVDTGKAFLFNESTSAWVEQ